VDAVYQYERGAVNLRSSFDNGAAPIPTPGLAAYISDDTSYNLMGKYTFEFGDTSAKDKLTLYAGYSHIEKAHGGYTSGDAQGTYPIDVGININDSAVYNMVRGPIRDELWLEPHGRSVSHQSEQLDDRKRHQR
jgi:hypothetical protein